LLEAAKDEDDEGKKKIKDLAKQYDAERRALCEQLRQRPAPKTRRPRYEVADHRPRHRRQPPRLTRISAGKQSRDMKSRIEQREYASCPPVRETVDPDKVKRQRTLAFCQGRRAQAVLFFAGAR